MNNPAIESVRFEDEAAREILAGPDIASLPRDYPLDRMAEDRMKELAEARAEIERLREENARLKSTADDLMLFISSVVDLKERIIKQP